MYLRWTISVTWQHSIINSNVTCHDSHDSDKWPEEEQELLKLASPSKPGTIWMYTFWSRLEGWQQNIQGREGQFLGKLGWLGSQRVQKWKSHIPSWIVCSYYFYYWIHSLYFGTEVKQKWIQSNGSTSDCIQTIRNVWKAKLKCKSFGLNHFYALQ